MIAVTDVASAAPETQAPEPLPPEPLTDDAILQRFLRTKNQPTGSQTLGFRMVSVSQEKMEVEVAFEAKPELLANPMKQVQGGYLCAMLDEAMSTACIQSACCGRGQADWRRLASMRSRTQRR